MNLKYLLCAIDFFSKYTWVVPLKDKREISIINAFQKILDNSNRKPNKIWVDEGGEFYNNLLKRFLKINNIDMYSTYNKGKSVVAERFIRTLKNKIFKHMTTVSKNVYFDVLDSIWLLSWINEDSNEKNPKFEVGNHVRISKYKNVFAKWYTQNWSEDFAVSKIKNTVP